MNNAQVHKQDANGNLIAVGAAASGAAAVGNPIPIGAVYTSGALGVETTGDIVTMRADPYGNSRVSITAQNPSANLDGVFTNIGVGYAQDNSTGSSQPMLLGTAPLVYDGTNFRYHRGDTAGAAHAIAKGATTGGLSAARVVTGTTGVIKGSAGQLYKLHSVRNANAAVRYLHLYDKATAPTLSTDTPILTISLLASSVQNEIDIGGDIGVAFANGIAWSYTTDNIAIPATAGTSTELMFSGAYK